MDNLGGFLSNLDRSDHSMSSHNTLTIVCGKLVCKECLEENGYCAVGDRVYNIQNPEEDLHILRG